MNSLSTFIFSCSEQSSCVFFPYFQFFAFLLFFMCFFSLFLYSNKKPSLLSHASSIREYKVNLTEKEIPVIKFFGNNQGFMSYVFPKYLNYTWRPMQCPSKCRQHKICSIKYQEGTSCIASQPSHYTVHCCLFYFRFLPFCYSFFF